MNTVVAIKQALRAAMEDQYITHHEDESTAEDRKRADFIVHHLELALDVANEVQLAVDIAWRQGA